MNSVLISEKDIQLKIEEMAQQIAQDHQGRPLVLVGVLTGAFIVLADLARALWRAGMNDLTIEFVKTSSYTGGRTQSNRCPKITLDLTADIHNKDVLIVEDIADTGYTLHMLQNHLKVKKPRSLKTFTLLNKPSRREVEVQLDYIGFEVDGWIEGYGLDSLRSCPAVMIR